MLLLALVLLIDVAVDALEVAWDSQSWCEQSKSEVFGYFCQVQRADTIA